MRSPDDLVHPVRLRVIMLLAASGEPLSAKELAARLWDVPHATLYRHVRVLADGGWLEKAEERQARGATEVRYTLAAGGAIAGAEEVATATAEDHQRWFGMFATTLMGAFARYSQTPEADPVGDGVRYRITPLSLSDADVRTFHTELDELVERTRAKESGPARLFATVSVPDTDQG